LARNQKLSKAHAEDANAIAEMRKILEIEGLLKAYADRLTYYAKTPCGDKISASSDCSSCSTSLMPREET
jgi:hypothetical protein